MIDDEETTVKFIYGSRSRDRKYLLMSIAACISIGVGMLMVSLSILDMVFVSR